MGRTTRRHLALALALTLLLGAATAWPAHAWGGRDGLVALAVGSALSLAGAALGHLAGGWMRRLDPAPAMAPRAVQTATAVRLLATLFLALPAVLLKWAPPMQVAVWLGVQYLGQLGLEVFVSVRELRQNHAPTEAAAPSLRPGTGTLPDGDAPDPPSSQDPGAPSG